MNFQKYIITEPVRNFRNLALDGLRGRWKAALVIAIVWYLALNLPVNLIYDATEIFNVGVGLLAAIPYNISSAIQLWQITGLSRPFPEIAGAGIACLYVLLVGGPLYYGLATLYLRFRRRQVGGIGLLFSGFNCFSRTFIAFFVTNLCIFLWSLLFIVPGIIAYYRYRLTFYILADNPQIGPLEAIRISKYLMHGNKRKLFLLDLSFIGWALLVSFVTILLSAIAMFTNWLAFYTVLDMGLLSKIANCVIFAVVASFLYVYHETATAAFYERSCGKLQFRQQIPPVEQRITNNERGTM